MALLADGAMQRLGSRREARDGTCGPKGGEGGRRVKQKIEW